MCHCLACAWRWWNTGLVWNGTVNYTCIQNSRLPARDFPCNYIQGIFAVTFLLLFHLHYGEATTQCCSLYFWPRPTYNQSMQHTDHVSDAYNFWEIQQKQLRTPLLALAAGPRLHPLMSPALDSSQCRSLSSPAWHSLVWCMTVLSLAVLQTLPPHLAVWVPHSGVWCVIVSGEEYE